MARGLLGSVGRVDKTWKINKNKKIEDNGEGILTSFQLFYFLSTKSFGGYRGNRGKKKKKKYTLNQRLEPTKSKETVKFQLDKLTVRLSGLVYCTGIQGMQSACAFVVDYSAAILWFNISQKHMGTCTYANQQETAVPWHVSSLPWACWFQQIQDTVFSESACIAKYVATSVENKMANKLFIWGLQTHFHLIINYPGWVEEPKPKLLV